MIQTAKMKLYLDIDGVILGKNNLGLIELIPETESILKYTRSFFDCYWLSTQSRHSKEDVYKYLKPFFNYLDIRLIDHIKPLSWGTLKTEAIDFNSCFIWIDDAPLQYELDILKKAGCIDNWLCVDSYKYFDMLTVDLIESKRQYLLSK